MLHLLLITSDPALAQAFEVVAKQLSANLICVPNVESSVAIPADIGLWHTDMEYDAHIYQQLSTRHSCVIVVCPRPNQPLRVVISAPYLIIPFDPDDACTVISGWYQRVSQSTPRNTP
jgi:hypothetical protein